MNKLRTKILIITFSIISSNFSFGSCFSEYNEMVEPYNDYMTFIEETINYIDNVSEKLDSMELSKACEKLNISRLKVKTNIRGVEKYLSLLTTLSNQCDAGAEAESQLSEEIESDMISQLKHYKKVLDTLKVGIEFAQNQTSCN